MKKICACFTVVALLCTTLLNSFSAIATNDIEGHWAQKTIEKWVQSGKIGGYPDGTFGPEKQITRAEFAVMLSRILPGDDSATKNEHDFSDVLPADWFYKDIECLISRGVVSQSKQFRPNSYITREDAMTMIGRAYQLEAKDDSAVKVFQDYHAISDYAVKYISALISSNILKGYSDKTIRPKQQITRAESVTLLDGFINMLVKNSLEDIMVRIYAGVKTQMPKVSNTIITPENSEYYLGISNMHFVEGIASESLIGSQAHSVCLVRVADGSDVTAIKEQIRTSVNPRKWICVGVERDQVIVENIGNLILLVIDQFAPKEIADSFLSLNLEESNTLLKPDKDNLMFTDGQYLNGLGTLRPIAVKNFATKVDSIINRYLKDSKNIYYAMIPSKNYYVNNKLETPFGYNEMDKILTKNIKGAKNINLTDCLSFNDYCKTDFHWKQDQLQKVLDRLGENLGFKVDSSIFQVNTVDNFKGQYGYGKLDFPSESLTYLTDVSTDQAVVSNYEMPDSNKVYNTEKLSTTSPYDLFLSGPTPLITIKNEKSSSDKELIIFRDSFSSSLAPLMIDKYKEIVLIDIRYVSSTMLDQFVKFKGQDVLFLYNDQIINHSEMLK